MAMNNTSEKIKYILQVIKERNLYMGFKRLTYVYDMNEALQIITAIGKTRNESFTIDSQNVFAYKNFIKWLYGDVSMQCIDPTDGKVITGNLNKGIYIAGNTGTGKSWCLDIMLTFSIAMMLKVVTDNDCEKNLYWVTYRADEITEYFMKNGEIDKFRQQRFLGIQDFGNEQEETLFMGNRMQVLRQLLEYRGDCSDALTMITSNLKLSGEKLRTQYGDRVQSRLYEMCNYLEIKGNDRRK